MLSHARRGTDVFPASPTTGTSRVGRAREPGAYHGDDARPASRRTRRRCGGEMAPARILIEPNAYHHLNVGDAAMLQIALERLGALWPRARLDVLTDDPERLRGLCPRAVPVPADGRRAWFGDLVPAVHRRLGEGASQRLRRAESA